MKAAYLKPGATIDVGGERCTVRGVEYTHKDGVVVRLRGRPPLHVRRDHEFPEVR